MNLLHLRYAVEVDSTRSITKAAENLFMGQPNLSRAIRELEETVGVTLFRRTSRGIVPTPQGEEFLAHARRVLDELDDMEARYRPDDSGRTALRISMVRADYLAQAFCTFAASPDCTASALCCQETDAAQTLESLLVDRYSLGILRSPAELLPETLAVVKSKGLLAEPLWEFRCVVLTARTHPLAGCEVLPSDALDGLPELCYGEPDFPAASVKQRPPRPAHRQIVVGGRCGRNELLCALPGAYMWSSPAPPDLLERYALAQTPCTDAPRRVDLLVSRAGGRLSAIDQQFLATLQQVREALPRQ